MADYDLGTAHGKIVVDYKDKGTGQAAKDLDQVKSRARALMDQFSELRKRFAKDAKDISDRARDIDVSSLSKKVEKEAVGIRRQLASINFGELSKTFANGAKEIVGHTNTMIGKIRDLRSTVSQSANQISADIEDLAVVFGIAAGALSFFAGQAGRAGHSLSSLRGPANIVGALSLAMGGVPAGAEGFPTVIKRAIQLSAALSLLSGSTTLLANATKRMGTIGTVTKGLKQFGGVLDKLGGPIHAVAGAALSLAFTIQQFRFVKQVAKQLAMFGGVMAGLGGSIHVVAGLAQAVSQLSGAIALLPAVAIGAGLAMATLKIGMSGFGDAMKNIGDPKKFAEAIKKLSPAAREAAIAIRDIHGKGFKALKLHVQEKLFAGIGKTITQLAKSYLPSLQTTMGTLAGSFNKAALDLGKFLNTTQGKNATLGALGNMQGVITHLTATFTPLIAAFIRIGEIGSKVLLGITGGAGAAAQKFQDFVYSAEGAKKIEGWILNGIKAIKDLWTIAKNVGQALTGIFSGLNGGEQESFLAKLAEMTTKFNEFVHSAEGARILGLIGTYLDKFVENATKLGQAFVKYVLPALEKFAPIMQSMSGGLIDGIIDGMKVLSPIFIALGTALTPIAPVLAYIFKGMVSMVVILAGLAVAAKIVMGAIFLLKVGLDTVKFAFAAAGFAARLLTGNLRKGEAMVLKFIGTLLKKMVVGLFTFIKSMVMTAVSAIVNTAKIVASWIWARIVVVAQWIWMAAQAVAHAVKVAVVWVAQTIYTAVTVVARWIWTRIQVFAIWLTLVAQAAIQAIATGAAWVLQTTLATGRIVAAWLIAKIQMIAHWVAIAAAATLNALKTAAAWLITHGPAMATALVQMGLAVIAYVAGWVMMATMAMVNAARMAAAWFIALGPIGWVIAAIIALVVLIIVYWDEIVAATKKAWEWVKEHIVKPVGEFISFVNGKVKEFISWLKGKWDEMVADVRAKFEAFKQTVKEKVDAVVTFFRELPGKVMAALATMIARATGVGRDIVNGLMNGLAALGNRIKDFLMEKARAAFDAVKSFFGIASPSKLMATIGENIVLGMVVGIQRMTGAVVNAASTLSDKVSTAITPSGKAAQEVLDQLQRGGKVFEDFSFKGNSKNVSSQNETILDAWIKAGRPGDTQRFLKDYIKTQTTTTSKIGAALGGVAGNLNPGATSGKAAGNIQTFHPNYNPKTWGAGLGEATRGGDGTTISGPISVTIDAKSVAEMKSVSEFFDKVQQTARAGKATK